MKNKLIYILFISLLFMQDEIASGLHSNNLISYLQNNYTTNSTLGYDNGRDILYREIEAYQNNGEVKGIYTNYSIPLPSEVDPSSHLYDNGINCEHLWPRSMGASSGNPKSDLHHLRPCKSNVNSARGNKPYEDINDNLVDDWYWLSYQETNIPSSNIDEYSEKRNSDSSDDPGGFEPREDVKGDIARSMFYFYTIYTSEANEADPDFFDDQKDILYQWHINDPADNNEIDRTWLIAGYQNDIPNPFILDSTLVYRCYFYDESEIGCDGVANSGLVNDDCGICDGDNSSCAGCDGVANSGLVNDDCGVCDGDNSSCAGCDGVANSNLEIDACGICGGNNSSCIDFCGIPNGENLSCADINNDDIVNINDVLLLINLILNGATNSLGDINYDGVININDIVMLVNIILGENL